MKNLYLLAVVAFCSMTLAGCVSSKRYSAAENSLLIAETDVLKMKQVLIDLEKDTARLGQELRVALDQKAQLEEYSAYSQSRLFKQMNDVNANLDEKNQRIAKLEKDLKKSENELKSKSEGLSKSSTQLTKVEKLINSQVRIIKNLRFASANAVAGFEGKNVEYIAKDGQVRIVVPENVLFNGTTTKLTKDGEVALMSIANVINQNKNYKVYIETHSDDNKTRNNWDFTATRAANIAKFLIKGGVYPQQVVPSARAEFAPVEMNDTPQNKAKNRRVELVLSPSFGDMYDLWKMYY